MNSENIFGNLDMGTQDVSNRGNQDKRGEIFTVRFADSEQACEDGIMGRGADYPRMDADECGPDLFFEIWNFSDAP